MTEAEYKSQFEFTKHIPYLNLMDELWDVFCEDLGEKIDCVTTTSHFNIL